MRPFVHMTIRSDGNHKHVSHEPGLSEITYVSYMQEIKNAVAEDNLLALRFQTTNYFGNLPKRYDLVRPIRHGHYSLQIHIIDKAKPCFEPPRLK
jgi:hypothetical protein